MKSFIVVAATAAAAFMSPAIAMAHDGTIFFTGEVTAPTCTYVSPDGYQSVALPKVSATALKRSGDVAGQTPFTVALKDCSDVGAKVAIHLDAIAFDPDWGTLQNTAPEASGAKKVTVALSDGRTGDFISVPGASASVEQQTDGTAVIPLMASYMATGQATAGAVTSSVNFSIIYP
jgi:major type 1 subunit fimbrin (pilin)